MEHAVVKFDGESRDRIIETAPEHEREEVAKLYDAAIEAGWSSIGYWTYDQPADKTDLYGVEPRTGWGSFINWETIAASRIPLSPEAKAENDAIRNDLLKSLRERIYGDGARQGEDPAERPAAPQSPLEEEGPAEGV